MAQSIKDTNKDDKRNLTTSDEAKFMPRIKPPWIANCYKFQKFTVKIATPYGKFAVSIFLSMNTLSYIKFFNHHKVILHLGITLNNLIIKY